MVDRPAQTAQFYEHLETQILRYFRQVTGIGSVTGTEYRVFDWLLRKVFPEFTDPATRRFNKLDISFVRGNQLLVSWNGSSTRNAKRIIVVAHTDHEGFLVRQQWIDTTNGTKQLWVRAEDPGGGSVEDWHAGADVQIAFGWRGEDARRRGKITEIVKADGVLPDYAKVQVELEKDEDPSRVLAEFNEHAWTLGVYPTFEEGADSGSGVRPNEPLSVPFVDNCAGVAVATAVLRTLVDSDADVNLSVLYTTGEEAGFVGLLRMLDGSRLAGALLDAVWIVLDASSHAGSTQIGMQEWYGLRVEGIQKREGVGGGVCDEVKGGDRCPENVAAIRLEDRCTIFDYSVALLLYQASLLVKSKLGATQLRERSWYKNIGVAGIFVRGECEATVLAHHTAFHEGYPKPPGLRIGALAIPVVNYRNYAGFNLGAMKPEVTRIGALTSAGFILAEACGIVSRTHLITAVEPRPREARALQKYVEAEFPDRIAELMGDPIERMKGYLDLATKKKLAEKLDGWAEGEGQRLLETLHPPPVAS